MLEQKFVGLLNKVVNGDMNSLGEIYQEYYNFAVSIGKSAGLDTDDAEDIASDVFADLPNIGKNYVGRLDVIGGAVHRRWLIGIIKHRAEELKRFRDKEELHGNLDDVLCGDEDMDIEAVNTRLFIESIRELIQLSDFDVLNLIHQYKLTPDETAAVISMSKEAHIHNYANLLRSIRSERKEERKVYEFVRLEI
jgi:DNA-directed RNA polymerase specialized sigma24 family protein